MSFTCLLIIFSCLAAPLLSLSSSSLNHTNVTISDVADDELKATINYLYKDGPLQCELFKSYCDFEFILQVLTSNFDNYTIISSNPKVCRFESSNFGAIKENDTNTNSSSYLYKLRIIPELVGRSAIILKANNSAELIYLVEVVITRPHRPIDYLFDVWLYLHCALGPFVMGILIEKEFMTRMLHSKEIRKELLLCFFCQFVMMPLVI